MRLSPDSPGPRAARPAPRGFTIVEVLVVILIIALLVGLLLPAISGIREKGNIATARNDISQISVAIGNWQQATGAKYLIDGITLNGNATTGADLAYLKSVWPRLDVNQLPPFGTLDGNQCLVLFLMGPNRDGIPKSSTAPLTYPAIPNPATALNSPYLDFPSNKVVNGRLVDPWGSPYVYFASRGSTRYNVDSATLQPRQASVTTNEGAFTVRAYYESAGKFANLTSFQIISAGPDQKFGPGGADWNPGNGQYVETIGTGFDDIANFNGDRQLGVSPR